MKQYRCEFMWIFEKKLSGNGCLVWTLNIVNFYNWLFQIVPLLHWSSTCTIGERLDFMCFHRWPNRSIHLSFLKWATTYITLSTIFLSMNISTDTMCIDMISRYCWCFCLWFLLMYVWCSWLFKKNKGNEGEDHVTNDMKQNSWTTSTTNKSKSQNRYSILNNNQR